MRRYLWLLLILAPGLALGADGHGDPVAGVVLHIAVVLGTAALGGHFAARFGQPAVLGELLAGVLLGNLHLVGVDFFTPIATDPTLDMLSRIGVLLLLFEVGLESTVQQMLEVGWTALISAVAGVIAPFVLGWLVGAWLLPDASVYVHVFLGAALTATSVGITARVLQDIGKSQTKEAHVILGAAVIDDVLGLIILAVVTGVIAAAAAGGALAWTDIAWTLLKAALFLVGALVIGARLSPLLFGLASKLQRQGVLLLTGLAFLFVFSWLANLIGLASIVGAFAAGLILERSHYQGFKEREPKGLEELIHPVSGFLVPLFFVLMGARTDLRAFGEEGVLVLALALTAVGIIGKMACGLAVVQKGFDRIAIGIGMVPRGEVGLIFANIGLGLTFAGEQILSSATFSAIVVVVMLTTFVTPPALKWAFARR